MALNLVSNFAANVAHRNLLNTDEGATSSLAKLSPVPASSRRATTPPRWPSARGSGRRLPPCSRRA